MDTRTDSPVVIRLVTEIRIWPEVEQHTESLQISAVTASSPQESRPAQSQSDDPFVGMPPGYKPIHVRKRVGTAILRNDDAELGKRYAVYDMVRHVVDAYTDTTRHAGELLREVKAHRQAAA